MPRRTRAAAKAQAEHVEPLGLALAADAKRDALRSITPNSVDGSAEAEKPIEEDAAKKKKSKAKGRKKKGKKDASDDKAKAENNDDDDERDGIEGVLPHPCPCLPLPADICPRPRRTPGVANRQETTPRQQFIRKVVNHGTRHRRRINVQPGTLAQLNGHANGDTAPDADSGPGVPDNLQTDQKTPSEPASLITSPTLAGPQPEDPIEALDFLEDAIEEVGKILPNLDEVAPEKPAKKENVAKPGPKPTTSGKPTRATAKAPPARTGPSLMKTTQPSATATRSRAIPATTTAPKLTTSTMSKRHSTIAPAKSAKDAATPATKTAKPPTDYLASKRRPISLQIPPPPERIRSAKPPTRPTFTLPGDPLTAKRKAAAEERKRKEDEELARKREFKARPVPGGVARGARPASMIVRQTASSRARMSVCGVEGAEALAALGASAAAATGTPGGLRRAGTVTGATTSTSKAAAAAAAARAAAKAKRSSVVAASAAAAPRAPGGPGAAPREHRRAEARRPRRRLPSGVAPHGRGPRRAARPRSPCRSRRARPAAPSRAEDAVAQRHKARAIYNRDRTEGALRERERREKEEAARRARAEAAEKGRIASREWAEKHKKRVASAAAAAKAPQVAVRAVE